MKKLYQLLLDRWNQKTDTVLVTIVEGNGSVPRTTGAYMVVAKNGTTRFAPFCGLGVVCAKEMRIINKKSPSAKADELICLYAEEGT